MRKLLKFILIIGVIGSLVYHLRATEPSTRTQADEQNRADTLTKADKLAPPSLSAPVSQPPAQKKIDNDTQVDSEQAALAKVMKAAIAARHGGALPKTLSDEDALKLPPKQRSSGKRSKPQKRPNESGQVLDGTIKRLKRAAIDLRPADSKTRQRRYPDRQLHPHSAAVSQFEMTDCDWGYTVLAERPSGKHTQVQNVMMCGPYVRSFSHKKRNPLRY
jgi:hypothetical protein